MSFLNICDRKKSNLIYGWGWYRTSVLLFIIVSPASTNSPWKLFNWIEVCTYYIYT